MLKRGLAAVVALLLAFGAVTWLALEACDVAVLETHGAGGSARRTRVWFAEHDGALWLEAPVPDREWLLDVQASPRVNLERAGVMQAYDAVPVAGGGHAEIRALLRAKYGWRDWWRSPRTRRRSSSWWRSAGRATSGCSPATRSQRPRFWRRWPSR